MTKEAFLNELRLSLKGLPKEDAEERISFYSEAISDRMEEGLSEEAAVADVGNIDDIVTQIASETSLVKLVKHNMKPKRSLRVWEIILLVLGFPLWFPLSIAFLVLVLVAYLLIWIFVGVLYIVDVSLAIAGIASIIYAFVAGFDIAAIGIGLMGLGGGILMYFGCIEFTKLCAKLSKNMFIGIKSWFIRKGDKNE